MYSYQNTVLRIESEIQIFQLNYLYIEEQFNKHMEFNLQGIISSQCYKEYENKGMLGRKMSFYDSENGKNSLLCRGIVTEAEIYTSDGIHYISMKGNSASAALDCEKKSRSFQDISMTYRELLQIISGEEFTVFYKLSEEKMLTSPMIQYMETDWEFILRLAGRLHTVVTVEALTEKCSLSIGTRKGRAYEADDSDTVEYYAHKNPKGHVALCCHIMHRDNMYLGDTICLKGRNWIITEKRIWFKQGNIEKEYALGSISDQELPAIINQRLLGAVISGKVLKRQKEYLKIWLKIDKEQNEETAFWYPYLPETGNLMYSLPEEGAEVTLNFPDGNEGNAFAGYCIHPVCNSGKLDYRIKKIQIPNDKSFSMTPDSIVFQSKHHDKRNTARINDPFGMSFLSNTRIQLMAKGELNFRAGLSLTILAQNQIRAAQSGDKNWIEISGNRICYQSEKYQTSSVIHESSPFISKQISDTAGESDYSLFVYFAGMLAQGKCDDVEKKMMGSIPALGATKGQIRGTEQMGLKVSRR